MGLSSSSRYATAGTDPPWPCLCKGGELGATFAEGNCRGLDRGFSTAHPWPPRLKGENLAQHPRREMVGICLSDAAAGRQLCRFNAPKSITSVAFAPDSARFRSGGANWLVGPWELPRPLAPRLVAPHTEAGARQAESRPTR